MDGIIKNEENLKPVLSKEANSILRKYKKALYEANMLYKEYESKCKEVEKLAGMTDIKYYNLLKVAENNVVSNEKLICLLNMKIKEELGIDRDYKIEYLTEKKDNYVCRKYVMAVGYDEIKDETYKIELCGVKFLFEDVSGISDFSERKVDQALRNINWSIPYLLHANEMPNIIENPFDIEGLGGLCTGLYNGMELNLNDNEVSLEAQMIYNIIASCFDEDAYINGNVRIEDDEDEA